MYQKVRGQEMVSYQQGINKHDLTFCCCTVCVCTGHKQDFLIDPKSILILEFMGNMITILIE